jgi:Short chain fatty acids transporter
LLLFSMQMVLVLVFGSAMAQAPLFKNLLKKIASFAKTPGSAILITTFIATLACWINWGFGLIIGALLAREMAKQVEGVDYRLLIASAYSGFLVWHGGLSGSIPLTIASETGLVATGGALSAPKPTSETIFSPLNLTIVISILILMPIVTRAMHPTPDKTVTIDPSLLHDEPLKKYEIKTPADKLEHSKILWLILLAFGFIYIFYYFSENGFNLSLDIVNMIFLFVGILLHGDLRRYIDAISEATAGASGIILQFPFYAGIMGMMTGAVEGTTSLAGVISTAFVNISNEHTFPLFTF